MITLRQEALQIVNDIPDRFLSELVQNLQNFKIKLENLTNKNSRAKKFDNKLADKKFYTADDVRNFFNSCPDVEPEKVAAMVAIAEWQERNKDFLDSDVDWDNERDLAMEEKYGSVD